MCACVGLDELLEFIIPRIDRWGCCGGRRLEVANADCDRFARGDWTTLVRRSWAAAGTLP
jgi:hypothetical protein